MALLEEYPNFVEVFRGSQFGLTFSLFSAFYIWKSGKGTPCIQQELKSVQCKKIRPRLAHVFLVPAPIRFFPVTASRALNFLSFATLEYQLFKVYPRSSSPP